MSARWDESKHPRDPEGTPKSESGRGGQFAKFPGGPLDMTPEQRQKWIDEQTGLYFDKEQKKWLKRDGTPVSPEVEERLKHFGVVPSWKNVHLNPDWDADMVAKGMDEAGRWQPRYTSEHTKGATADIHARVAELTDRLPTIRERLTEMMNDASLSQRDRETAAALLLVHKTAIRIGGTKDTKAKVKAFGATTLMTEHIRLGPGGRIELKFPGKSGKENSRVLFDQDLHSYFQERLLSGKGVRLFNTDDERARVIMSRISGGFTPKDYRTWHGTAIALKEIAKMPVPKTHAEYLHARKQVGRVVSEFLSNTPDTALKFYINPTVFAPWQIPETEK